MSNPVVHAALVFVFALLCLALAAAVVVKTGTWVLRQVRAMRGAGANTPEAGQARARFRTKVWTLGLLFVFTLVPATLSYAHLIDYATNALQLSGGLQYLVPLALDEAGMYLMLLAFQDIDADQSAAVNRMLVWAFVGGSAWFNWVEAPRGAQHPGAPYFFAGMSLAAGILFERGAAAVRRLNDQKHGTARRPLPRVRILRWLTAPRETYQMIRLAVLEPEITTEDQALAAVRLHRAIEDAQQRARQEARQQALQAQPVRWYRRRLVVTIAQPMLAVPGSTTMPAAALAAVVAPYATAEAAAHHARKDVPAPLAFGRVLLSAAQLEEARDVEATQAELTTLEERAQKTEAQADATEAAVVDRFLAELAPLEAQSFEGTADGDDQAEEIPTHEQGQAQHIPAGHTDQAAAMGEKLDVQCTGTNGQEQDDEPEAQPDRKAAAAGHGDTSRRTVSVRVSAQPGDEPEEHGTVDLGKLGHKRDLFTTLFNELVKPGDHRNPNQIALDLTEVMQERHGVAYDRGSAAKLAKKLQDKQAEAHDDEDGSQQQRGA